MIYSKYGKLIKSKERLIKMATKFEVIKNWVENIADTDDLISVVSNVNSWNGALMEYTFYWMTDLDDLFSCCSAIELLNKLAPNFNTGHDGFIDTYAGLESCNAIDVATDIRDNAEEVAEAIAEAMEEYDIYIPSSLEELLEEE